MAVTPLRERKAWQDLNRHHAEMAGSTCGSCSPRIPGGASA